MKINSRSKNLIIPIIWLVLAFCFLPARFAHAYIDPGTGSYIIQVIIGVFLGAAYAVKHYWRQIVARIKNRKNLKDK